MPKAVKKRRLKNKSGVLIKNISHIYALAAFCGNLIPIKFPQNEVINNLYESLKK